MLTLEQELKSLTPQEIRKIIVGIYARQGEIDKYPTYSKEGLSARVELGTMIRQLQPAFPALIKENPSLKDYFDGILQFMDDFDKQVKEVDKQKKGK